MREAFLNVQSLFDEAEIERMRQMDVVVTVWQERAVEGVGQMLSLFPSLRTEL